MFAAIDQVFSRHAASGPLMLRLGLGVVFLAHAYLKAFVYTLPGAAGFFEHHGFPGWTVYPVFLLETLGGVALLAGYQTRVVSLALFVTMLGALKPHLANGWNFAAPGGGWEYVAFLLVALAAQALMGAGAHAVGR